MFSGAELAALVNEAALIATMENKEFVDQDDLEEARDKIRWGRAKKSSVVDERDRRIDTGNPAYVDYGLLLTQWEAWAWDKQCREAFAQDPRTKLAVVGEAMRQWETMLKTASWVIVESYEWESGME